MESNPSQHRPRLDYVDYATINDEEVSATVMNGNLRPKSIEKLKSKLAATVKRYQEFVAADSAASTASSADFDY